MLYIFSILIKFYLFFYIIVKDIYIYIGNNYRNLTFNEKYFFQYINYNKNKGYKDNSNKASILIDCFPAPQWIFVNSIIANLLAEKYDAKIISYGLQKRPYRINKLYNSFNCREHLRVRLNMSEEFESLKYFINIISKINTKSDLLNYEIDGVNIGLDIYDTILKSGLPTVNIKSFRTYKFIILGLRYYFFAKRVISKKNIKFLLLSHDNYISMGTIAKVAWKMNIPVYFANPFQIMKINRPFEIYGRFTEYPKYFNNLSSINKISGIEWSSTMLNRRISGEVGVMMNYQIKSAFGKQLIERQTKNTDKLKVVIATHCFFDSPNCLGWMLFPDFYEWISYIGKLSIDLNYEVYIKPHNDYLPGTIKILKKLINKYPSIQLINPSTTWHQLKAEGVKTVLTCYGSIGHELPLLGFKVINAAYNPHIAYNFNLHPKTIEEYENILKYSINDDFVFEKNDIFEFFYIHKNLLNPDNLFFSSTQGFLNKIKNGENDFKLFLDESQTFEHKVINYFSENEF